MAAALQRPHVLIVSDDLDLTAFLSEGLVYAGFWTSVIASALQTLEVFRLRTFDIMILDSALGGIGATELAQRLRGSSHRADTQARTDIPILAIASSEEELDPSLFGLLGRSSVLVAPLDLDDLARAIDHAVRQWRAAHPDRPWADEAALGPQ